MESFIEEFQGDHEKTSELVVTVDGPSGAGTGTLASFIAEELGINCYSAGDFFRGIAADRDMTVEELGKVADKQTDLKVDRRTLEKGLSENCVIEARIPSRVLGTYSDLRIYLTADLEERAKRVSKDQEEGKRENEEKSESLEEVKERIRKRDEENWRRYKDYYGIENTKDIYDVLIDNTEMTIDEQQEQVRKILERKFPEQLE
ncbi:(d)CMP kinase [Candidatus Nanohalococcus occultus]|uniref:Cytidylate kinase n=1 Tax=Candidatus Nanohalococcus occultus TaxID=2978047 RepID=A0ABY8CDD0_9ARCH|nr:Cytidylate kinase [Candidatus Nanohaloarchaeota archaeon SVXNc]